MALVVQKFGGSSVGSIERIKNVATIVANEKKSNDCIVVVSAMSGETNRLLALAKEVSENPDTCAQDMLVASGEQVSCSLLAMALTELGCKAMPLLGFQVGIQTNEIFSDARIESINTEQIKTLLKQGIVPVIAGFQGVHKDENNIEHITTLGRGGSDTSAVAIAAAMKADRCDIYTDVNGVYTTDPRVVPEAKKIDQISFSEMMELASLGAKVLHMRSVEIAAKYGVNLAVRSTFEPENLGTVILGENEMLEAPVVSSITSSVSESLISIELSEDEVKFPAKILNALAKASINIDIISVSLADKNGKASMQISLPRESMSRAKEALATYKIETRLEKAAKVSVVGVGMKSHSGVAARIFTCLETNKIPVFLITTSEIKVSVVVDEAQLNAAIGALHSEFL